MDKILNEMTQLQLCYMDGKYSKTVKPLTAALFKDLVACELTKQTMKRIEQEPDEEKKNLLKSELLVAFYACQMPSDGSRPRKEDNNVKPSGLCLHDFDHMPMDVRSFYLQQIAGKEQELGIMLAHITPRGKGLRLVTVMNPGENVVQCQKRMAEQLGLTSLADSSVKDLTRMSFIPGKDYILYLNEEMFSLPAPEETEPAALADSSLEGVSPVAQSPVVNTVVEGNDMAKSLAYDGVKYNLIIEELLNRLATLGQPREGERNTDLYALVRELRHCTEYNFATTYALVKPYFKELPDQEIRRTINSALSSCGRSMTPTMMGVLKQLRNEQAGVEDTDVQKLPELPKLPPVIEKILKLYPKRIHNQVVIAMLPILGAYSTHARFRYWDNRVNTTTFLTALVGKSQNGKSFGQHLHGLLTRIFANWDLEERQKARAYQNQMTHRKEGQDFPEDPKAKIRLFGDDMTTSILLEYLDNLNGEHGLQFTEEVIRLVKARKSRFSDNDDLYCKSFDNAMGGKESKSTLTQNTHIPIYLNILFSGTYHAMHDFFNNPEGGLNNRLLIAELPPFDKRSRPCYKDPSPELEKEIEEMLMNLWKTGTQEEEEGLEIKDFRNVHQGKKELEIDFLIKAIEKWLDKCDAEDDENPNETWRVLANRAAVNGFRGGVLMWMAWGRPKSGKALKYVRDFAVWLAESARIGVDNFSGEDYEKLNAQHYNLQPRRQTKNKKLFSLLADEFTQADVMNIRLQNGESTNVGMIISRWKQEGLIIVKGNGTYVKVRQIA